MHALDRAPEIRSWAGGIGIRLRPAVVVCRYYKRDFILDLFQKSLISAEDYKKLTLFLKENYTRKKLGEESYYIRNDRL